jgi:4-amino-4-deoxy-L-arabinose transferase-like glycosyltransferase
MVDHALHLTDALTAIARPRVALFIIIALGLMFYFIDLGHPMYTFGEPREGVTVIDVLSGHGLILPRDPIVEMPFKPPMMRWLASLSAELAGGLKGLTETTMRLPSATLGIGGMLVCYAYGAALFEPIVGLLAALMLGTSLQYLQAATIARVDMTFTFFLEVALFEFLFMAEGLTSRWLLFYLAVAGAVLSKGPAGFVVPASVAIVWSVVERRQPTARLRVAPGLVVVALLAGGWYAAAIAIGGTRFVLRQLVDENLFAVIHNSTVGAGHNHTFLWLSIALLAGWLPWTLLLPWVVADLAPRWRRPRSSYLIIWSVTVVLFYSLAHQKRGIYLLAIYPALAVLTAGFVRHLDKASLPRLFPAVGLIGGVAFMGFGLGELILLPVTLLYPSIAAKLMALVGVRVASFVVGLRAELVHHGALAASLPSLTLLFGLGLIACRSKPLQLFGMMVGGIGTAIVAAQLFIVPAIAYAITLKNFAEESIRLIDHHSVDYLIGLNYEFSFYSRRRIDSIAGPGANGPDFLLADAEYYHLHAHELNDFEAALESGPANLDGTGAMVLLRRKSPDRVEKSLEAQDRQTGR